MKAKSARVLTHTVILAAGNHTLRWMVDTKQEVLEIDESAASNELEVQMKWIEPSDLPDLVVDDIWHEGPLLVGEKQQWNVRIRNKGKTAAQGMIWTTLSIANGVQFAAFNSGYLDANATETYTIVQPPDIKPGNITIIGVVNAAGLIAESNNNNNYLKKTFSISCVDLEAVDLNTVTDTNGKAKITLIVRNNGPANAEKPFKVKFWPGEVYQTPKFPFLVGPKILAVPKLNAGDSVSLKHEIPNLSLIDYQAWMNVDPDYVYHEQDLTNNVLVKEIRGRRVVLIIIDGLRPDAFNTYLSSQIGSVVNSGFREMGLSNPAVGKIIVKEASTVFPSITLCANASIVTGLYPANHGITGNCFYKRPALGKWTFIDYETKELAPTLYGFWDDFGGPNYNALLGNYQRHEAGDSGPDKDLAFLGVETIYDILKAYNFPSHVIFHFYSKGAGYPIPSILNGHKDILDGWDAPTNQEVIFSYLLGKNNAITYFNSFDKMANEKAVEFIQNLPPQVPFPRLLTLYFSSVDHASHTDGVNDQALYLTKIDQGIYNVIKAMSNRFPEELNNTVFIITSDHGHETVDRHKFISSVDVLKGILSGPWTNSLDNYLRKENLTKAYLGSNYSYQSAVFAFLGAKEWPSIFKYASNGPMAYIYDCTNDTTLLREIIGNMCFYWKIFRNLPTDPNIGITHVLGRMPGSAKYHAYSLVKAGILFNLIKDPLPKTFPDISAMLGGSDRSGDIILIVNQKNRWQLAESGPGATNFSIPLTSIQSMRIPLSEHYNSYSTHGGVDTMRVPLVIVGKPIPKIGAINSANIVDIVPTILNIFGLPLPAELDGKPLLDIALSPVVI